MRVGASLLMAGNIACQSHAWQMHRPIGNLETAISSLGKLTVDEIAVINIDARSNNERSAIDASKILSDMPIMSPLLFGGGINCENFDQIVSNAPADRYILSSSLIEQDFRIAIKLTETLGKQSLVGCLPFKLENDRLQFFNTSSDSWQSATNDIIANIYECCDEVIWYDAKRDGRNSGFNVSIFKSFAFDLQKTILCGGVGKEEYKWARRNRIAAVYIENRILHRETK